MNLTALALKAYIPMRLKRQKLNSLIRATEQAFDVDLPDLDHLSFEQCLEKYAILTNEEVRRRLQSGDDMLEVKNALYEHAYSLGNELRQRLHLRSAKDILAAGKALYRAIGIDFEGSSLGPVVIRSCFFSRFYSGEVCRIMCSLDEGIAAGLSGGCKLSFSQRITDGRPCCEAFFDFDGHAA